MSFQATLTVEGKAFSVLQCRNRLSQRVDRGKPVSGVHGGMIVMILEGTNDDLLGEWATGATVKKDGTVVFNRVDQESAFQRLEFTGAYVTHYFEIMMTSGGAASASNYEAMMDCMVTDVNTDNEHEKISIENVRRLLKYVNRTGSSNCILLRLSSQTIKVNDVQHQNG